MQNKLPFLAVVGPTAGGKSKLAVELAKRVDGEIVSCDSMQIYRHMDIGTAKPTAQEMGGIPHHLLDIAEPEQPFSCSDYVRAAADAIAEICGRAKLPVLCGGTGLYLDRLLMGGTSCEDAAPDEVLRARLAKDAEEYGVHALHERLREVDPASADAIHENNVHRVIRALEIYQTTGVPKSEWDRRDRMREPNYRATVIGLRYESRELLYDRINRRVEDMLRAGLLEETRRLLAAGVFEANSTAAQAIGYKELLGYLRGEETYAEATEQLRQATRRYAKRQMTWFNAKPYVNWITADRNGEVRPGEELIRDAMELIRGRDTMFVEET